MQECFHPPATYSGRTLGGLVFYSTTKEENTRTHVTKDCGLSLGLVNLTFRYLMYACMNEWIPNA